MPAIFLYRKAFHGLPLLLVSISLLTIALVAFSPHPALAADPFAAADINVSQTIVAADVEPIGANLTTIAGGTNFAINNHVWNSRFEPMVLRKFIRIDRAGAD